MAQNELIEQSKNFFKKLTTVQKSILGGVAALMIAGIVLLFMSGSSKDMGVLFSNLEEQESGKIIEKLKERKIEYQLNDKGTTIMVDRAVLYETRLSLANEGLPESGVVGYELFDKTNLGMSEFVQKLNFRRAIEGELAKTINSIDEVKKARVHLVIPEKTLFEKDQKFPTASVTLHLKSNKGIGKVSIEGIQNLVSSSVEGMQAGNVTVVDSRGKILSSPTLNETSVAGLTAAQHEQQIKVEQYVTSKVQSLLDGVLGVGNSEVRINAELDFTQTEKTVTDFDPEKQIVRSEQNIQQTEKNIIPDSLFLNGVSSEKGQQNNIQNYEIAKTVAKIVEEVGNIKRLSVAAMVNGTNKIIDNNGIKTLQYTPRTDEEMQKLNEIVKNAVGFSPERKDQISVLNVPFDTSVETQDLNNVPVLPWWQQPDNIKILILVVLMILTVFLMFLILQSKRVKSKMRIAMGLPETIAIEDELEKQEEEEELEEIILDDEDMLLLPAELPEQLLLQTDRLDHDIEDFEEEIEDEGYDTELLSGRASARFEDAEPEMSEERLMKIEIKGKVQEFIDKDTSEAVKLVRMLLMQDNEEKALKP
jgi:flagellar M-ring protein FliF